MYRQAFITQLVELCSANLEAPVEALNFFGGGRVGVKKGGGLICQCLDYNYN